jgi:MFS family permease
LAYWAASPSQLLLLRFLACLGIGGMWPNGVAIVSEAWSDLSRPILAGIMGTAANVGLLLMAVTATGIEITPQSWRWVMLVGATPVVLGLFVLARVPESPRWLASRQAPRPARQASAASIQVFRPPLRRLILLGIALGTVPLLGGWGASNWMIPWAGEAGAAIDPPDPFLKAWVQFARSLTGMIGSLLGGVIASLVGRRRTYFLMSLGALFTSQYMFWLLTPVEDSFLIWASALGFFSGVYFGWLPLFLPELFPTAVRSTGAGVSFNFGRILTAAAVLMAGWLIAHFDGDYARIGRVTSLIYAVGMVVICFAPESSDHRLRD